jgi:hypothetical protein
MGLVAFVVFFEAVEGKYGHSFDGILFYSVLFRYIQKKVQLWKYWPELNSKNNIPCKKKGYLHEMSSVYCFITVSNLGICHIGV